MPRTETADHILQTDQDHFYVVCLGGSAGATGVYANILSLLPGDTGIAFVVVPHRGSSEPFQLTQLLSRATSMATCEIEHGMRLTANCVFVLPPGFQLTLSDARFVLSKTRERHGWPTTLSVFLCSLAESLGSRAIAVILSGLGNDGASALAAVKAAGGQTFAQADARWEGMPDGAVATGNIDFTMTPAEIANALSALSQTRQSPRRE